MNFNYNLPNQDAANLKKLKKATAEQSKDSNRVSGSNEGNRRSAVKVSNSGSSVPSGLTVEQIKDELAVCNFKNIKYLDKMGYSFRADKNKYENCIISIIEKESGTKKTSIILNLPYNDVMDKLKEALTNSGGKVGGSTATTGNNESTPTSNSTSTASTDNEKVPSKSTSGLSFGEGETIEMPCSRLKLINQYGFTQELYNALFNEHLLVQNVENAIQAQYHSFESQDAGLTLKSGVKSFTNFPMTKDKFLETFYGYAAADFPDKVSKCNDFLNRMVNEGILKYDEKTKMYDVVTVFDRPDFPKKPISGAAMTKEELLNYYFIKEDELNRLVADGTFILENGKYKLNDTALFLDIGMYYNLRFSMQNFGRNGVGLQHIDNIAQYIEMVGETVHLGWQIDHPVPEKAECALFKVKDDAPREVLEYIFKAVFYNSDNITSSHIYERYLNNELTHLVPFGGLMQNEPTFETRKTYDDSINRGNMLDPDINDYSDLETDSKIALFANWMNFINYPENFGNNVSQSEELTYKYPLECKYYPDVMELFTDAELDELQRNGIMPDPEKRTTTEIQRNKITLDLNRAQAYFGFNISTLDELKAAFNKKIQIAASKDINNGTLMLTQEDVDILRNFAKECDEKGKKHGVQTNIVGEYETFINEYLVQIGDKYVFDLDRIKKDYPDAYEEMMCSCNCTIPNYIENREQQLCYYDNKMHLWETDGEVDAMQKCVDIIIKAMYAENRAGSSSSSVTNSQTTQTTDNSTNDYWSQFWGGQTPWTQNNTTTKEQAIKRYLKQDLDATYLGPGAAAITLKLHELFPVGSSIEDNFHIPYTYYNAKGQLVQDRIIIWPDIKKMMMEPNNIDNMLKDYENRINNKHNSPTVRSEYQIILDYMKPLAEKIKEAYAKVERQFSGGVYEQSSPEAYVEAYEEYLIPVLEWLKEYDMDFCQKQLQK